MKKKIQKAHSEKNNNCQALRLFTKHSFKRLRQFKILADDGSKGKPSSAPPAFLHLPATNSSHVNVFGNYEHYGLYDDC